MLKTLFLLSLILITSCTGKIKQSIKDAKYNAYEMIGYEKRDLFKNKVKTVKNNQEDTQEAFADALSKIQALYSFDGGKIEHEYNKLKNAYENSFEEAEGLRESIKKLSDIAQDLFSEWQNEITKISRSDLQKKSSYKLTETKQKYAVLYQKLQHSEKQMSPLLTKINDQVLYLKHNLNAAAIAGLEKEGDRIEQDIKKLIADMKASHKEADEFIQTL